MPEREWTSDQREAIENRNGNLVVSAAAGSGKTAVLVERIIRRLTDAENPTEADRLLVVTFTRAATAEVRSRLGAALRDELAKNPLSEHLQRQQMLISSANIYTIDAFCGGLVRENFDTLGIAPDFTLLDEGESKILQRLAASTVIEQLYAEGSADFTSLVELIFAGKDDSSLDENIIKLYNYSRAYPSPEKWLNDMVREYDSSIPLKDSVVGSIIIHHCIEELEYHEERMCAQIELLSNNPSYNDIGALGTIREECAAISVVKKHLESFELDEAFDFISRYSFDRWNARPYATEPEIQAAKAIRDDCKKCLSNLGKYICSNESVYKEDLDFLRPLAVKLSEAVKLFEATYASLKVERNAYDFSDISHMALSLLVEDPADNNFKRTPLAVDIGLQFDEILIDEYQDTNKAQDMLFSAVSNGDNLFVVGDVKQSIYGFRQAMPEVFQNKKKTFASSVTLGKNFRSRKGVTDYINFVFSQLMSVDCGNIIYDKNEELVFGAKYEKELPEPEVELHVLSYDKEDCTSLENEARFIAKYINDKVENCGENYKDFAILLKVAKGSANVIEKILIENGIPVYTENGEGFFGTADISVIVSLLRVIDNPLLDVPLLSVLMSPIFGFTPDDVSRLRINDKYSSLFAAVQKGEEYGDEKCISFLKEIRRYRRLSISLPAGELLRQIYEDTVFPSIASAMPGGKQRAANLRLLVKYADSYDAGSSYGLSGFIRYIDRLIENGGDQSPAGIMSENSNVVRIMTIHKSKGLEFKYCFLANTTHGFNRTDENKNLVLHPTYGIGIKGRDLSTGNTYPTMIHRAVQLESEKRSMSETMRVLYVALTRAREKLIILGSISEDSTTAVDKAVLAVSGNAPVNPYAVRHSNSFFEWLIMSAIRHPAAKCLRDISSYPCAVMPAEFDMICELHQYQPKESDEVIRKATINNVDENLVRVIENRMSYEYPYLPLTQVFPKRSASKILNGEFSSDFFASARPEFLSKHGLTPSERGTCLHKFMQYVDFQAAESNLDSEFERLVKENYLTEREISAVDAEKVRTFLSSRIYARMKSSQNLMREKKFAVLVAAGKFDESLLENKELYNESVLIQGIADCVFEEGDHLVVVDYKTDRETDENLLTERHRVQLETYVQALSKIFDLPVTEAYIYAFSRDQELRVI